MRTTTVVWNLEDGDAGGRDVKRQEIHDAAEAIAGPEYRVEITTVEDDAGTISTVTRSWPDLASAEAWVTKALELGAASAVVNPE
jgi:hypothetical protein